MAPLRKFQYSALTSARSTRLIKLFPARRPESDIKIELSEFNIDSNIEYEALSYTWDDQQPTKEIICNGMLLSVTENVLLALQRLRSNKAKQRMLWIDAISINQKNEAEKTEQVSNMGHLYSHATRVNIWLSRPTPAMKKAFEYLRLTAGPEVRFPHIPDDDLSDFDDGLCQLCAHPYWTRIWTVQEAAMNKNCHIYLGKLKPMDKVTFGGMLWDVEGYLNLRREELASPVSGYLYPVSFRRGSPSMSTILHRAWDKEMALDDALLHLMTKKAKNPLDLVFACRALFPDSFGQSKVNYARDLSDLLREVTIQIFLRFKKLSKLFSLICHCPPVAGAPSWTLNLQSSLHLYSASHYFGEWYNARDEAPNTAHILPDGMTMCVKGIIIDEVLLTSCDLPHYNLRDQEQWHRDIRTMLRNWRAQVNDSLRRGFWEAIYYILFSAVDGVDNVAAKIAKTTRFEPTRVIDEKGPLSNVVYSVRPADESDDLGHLDPKALEKKRQGRKSALREWLDGTGASLIRLDVTDVLGSSYSEDYQSTTHSPALSGRALFTTKAGRMGLVKGARPGDFIALISGCDLPFVLRTAAEPGNYTLVQPAVLEGVMSYEEREAITARGWETIQIV